MQSEDESAFGSRLAAAVTLKSSPVMVGLDPRWEQLPAEFTHGGDGLIDRADAYLNFCVGVIDAVAELAPIVKPQAAFFEQLGPRGMLSLQGVIQHARLRGVLVVLDAKRGDIGSTAAAYADGILGSDSPWAADAVTVNPYLGSDSLQPFVDVARKRSAGLFVLVKTSNPGSGELQDLSLDGETVSGRVAGIVERANQDEAAGRFGSVGAVVGATYPEQQAELRAKMPSAWVLVPGYGSQGGTAADVAGAFHNDGLGAVVNSSRGIIFAHARQEYAGLAESSGWQAAVEAATRAMLDDLRTHTPAGRLVE